MNLARAASCTGDIGAHLDVWWTTMSPYPDESRMWVVSYLTAEPPTSHHVVVCARSKAEAVCLATAGDEPEERTGWRARRCAEEFAIPLPFLPDGIL